MPKVINKIIKILIASDFMLFLGWGILSPVFAIFILEKVSNTGPIHAAEIAGLAAFFYWVPKAFFEVPMGIYLDKNPGEKDDFWFMITGMFIISLVPIGYMFSFLPWHIYVLQVIYAAGQAMVLPSWLAIFTRHIDKGKEAFEWSLETAFLSIGTGVTGGVSGVVIAFLGFNALFIFVSVLTILSMALLLLIRNNLSARDKHSSIFILEKPGMEP